MPAESAEPASAPLPRIVRVVAFLMVANVLCGFWLVGLAASLGAPSTLLQAPDTRIALALMGWQIVCSLLLVRPLLAGSVTAWAAVQGLLVAEASGDFAGLMLLASFPQLARAPSGGPSQDVCTAAIRSTIELALCILLFRARGWFGVGEREGWRVMWRRGWWALLITGGLTLAYLTAAASLFLAVSAG